MFLHGFLETELIFAPFEARNALLTNGALRLRLPGHSPGDTLQSTEWHLEGDRFLERYLSDIQAHFGPRPVRIVAHSTGGLVALALAHRYPRLVSDLFLMGALSSGRMDGLANMSCRLSTAPYVGGQIFCTAVRYALGTPARYRAQIEAVTAGAFAPLEIADDMRQDLLQVDPRVLHAVLNWLVNYDLSARLPQINAPVLSVIGLRDPVVPPAHQLKLLQRLPNGHAHLLDTGHLPFLEAPGAIDDLFTSWLAKPNRKGLCADTENLQISGDLHCTQDREPGMQFARTMANPQRSANGSMSSQAARQLGKLNDGWTQPQTP